MTPETLRELVKQGESIEVEFKTSQAELSGSAFETICAFLNRKGGHLLLGVRDNGTIEGVREESVQRILNGIVTSANNSQKLHPPFYLSPQVIEVNNRKIIYLYVPESSQVHSTAGRIFDRNEDGDFDITKHSDQVTQLYLRKQATYSENRVFPALKLADFNADLLLRIRAIVRNLYPEHPWLALKDADLMRHSGLYRKDAVSGKEGYTLAAALLLGTDATILSILSYYKTDAILRVENLDRYDDRDDIRTNLIDSYDRLMAFVQKHLPDKFFQENTNRVSVRDRLFREVVSNLLIHREFGNAFPAKLIIEKDRVYTENWNRPHGSGTIDPANFSPFPKNPVIARFFKEIGRVDELGSGIRNTFKYCGIYTPGTKPEFIEGDIFKTIIPLKPDLGTTQMTTQIQNRIITLIKKNPAISRKEIAAKLGDVTEDGVKYHLEKMKQERRIKRVGGTRGHWKINE